MNNIKNENISIGSINGKLFVSAMEFIPSDFHKAKNHIYSFEEVLNSIDIEPKGNIEIKKHNGLNYKHIIAAVDNIDYLKISYYPDTGWIIGFSVALPKDIDKAKCVVNAMKIAISNAEELTISEIKRKASKKEFISSKVIKTTKNENEVIKEVVEAILNGDKVFFAEREIKDGIKSDWNILNILKPTHMSFNYLVKYNEIIQEMLVCLKNN